MRKKEYSMKMFAAVTSQGIWDFSLMLERDFITEQELANAPGVLYIVDATSSATDKAFQCFLVYLDPSQGLKSDAQAKLEAWLRDRIVKLDDNIWDEHLSEASQGDARPARSKWDRFRNRLRQMLR